MALNVILKSMRQIKIQDTPELEELAKTEGGSQKHIYYNPTWNYFKEQLNSEEGSRVYAKRKTDVEPVFGRLNSVFLRSQSPR